MALQQSPRGVPHQAARRAPAARVSAAPSQGGFEGGTYLEGPVPAVLGHL